MRRLGQNFSAFLLYFALIALVFTGVISGRGVFFAGDISQHYVPWETAVDEEIDDGKFPLWENSIFCGYPIHAEGQSAILYPITRTVYRFFNGARGFSIDMLLHLILGGFFLYLLARKLKMGFYPSLYAGAVFTLAGYPVCLMVNAPILRSVAWVPIIILLTWSVWQGNRFRSSLLLTLCLAMQILAGSIQVVVMTLVFMLFVSICVLIARLIHSKPSISPVLIICLIVIPLAFMISAAQLIPTYELYQRSFIYLDAGDESTSYSFSPYHLLDLIIPPYWAQDKEVLSNSDIPFQMTLFLYIGTIPFVMALIGFFMSRPSWTWKLLAIIGILMGLGGNTFFYPIMVKILPPLANFRSPDRFLIIYSMSASLLAGFGYRYFLGKELPPDPIIKRKWYILAVIIVPILLFFGLMLDRFLPNATEQIYDDLRFSVFNLISLGNIFSNLSSILNAAKIEIIVAFVLIVVLIVSSILLRKHPSRVFFLGTIIFLLSFCEVGYYLKVNPGTRLISPDYYSMKPASVQAIEFAQSESVPLLNQDYSSNPLKQDESTSDLNRNGPFRISVIGSRSFGETVFGHTPLMLWYHGGATREDFFRFREILNPNFANNYDLDYVSGISSLYTSSWDKFMGIYENQVDKLREDPEFFRNRLHIWDLCGVKYIVSNVELPEGRLELRHHGEVYVYENKRSQPRAFILYPEKVLPETLQVLGAFMLGSVDPVKNIILKTGKESFYQKDPLSGRTNFSPVRINKYENGKVELSGVAVTDGYLILTDAFYPGWECRINDEKKEIYRAYGYFRAVPIESGRFTATFNYRPTSFRLGIITSSIGILIWIILAVFAIIKKETLIEESKEYDLAPARNSNKKLDD
ncbi:MAG: YfhO family protein [bacterium]